MDTQQNKFIADSVPLRFVPSDNMELSGLEIEITDDQGAVLESYEFSEEELKKIMDESNGCRWSGQSEQRGRLLHPCQFKSDGPSLQQRGPSGGRFFGADFGSLVYVRCLQTHFSMIVYYSMRHFNSLSR